MVHALHSLCFYIGLANSPTVIRPFFLCFPISAQLCHWQSSRISLGATLVKFRMFLQPCPSIIFLPPSKYHFAKSQINLSLYKQGSENTQWIYQIKKWHKIEILKIEYAGNTQVKQYLWKTDLVFHVKDYSLKVINHLNKEVIDGGISWRGQFYQVLAK